MAQETISSAILIIAAIIATVVLVNAIYPSLLTTTGSVGSVSAEANSRVSTSVKITETSHPNSTALFVWVKNIGTAKVPAGELGDTDVYFGDGDNMARVSPAGQGTFGWSYVLEDTDGDGSWGPGETLEILISDPGAAHLTAGVHYVKLVLYNSASVQDQVMIGG